MRDPRRWQTSSQPITNLTLYFIDNHLGSRRDYLRALCHALRRSTRCGVRRCRSMLPMIQGSFARWRWPAVPGFFVGFESALGRQSHRRPEEDSQDFRLLAAGRPFSTISESRSTARLFWALTMIVRMSLPVPQMGRGEPPGMRDLPHPYAIPGDTIIQANGNGGSAVTPRLELLRHRSRGFPAPAHDAGRTGAGIRLDLPAALLS